MAVTKVDTELAHAYIIKDLVVRTLEHDLLQMRQLKTFTIINEIYSKAIKEANEHLGYIKAQMAIADLQLLEVVKDGENIRIYKFAQKNVTRDVRYVNYALRNHTLREIEKLLGVGK